MKVEVGKTYSIKKNGTLDGLYKSLTIVNIVKLADGVMVYNTREGFSLFSEDKSINKWNINNVLNIPTLKEERKVKLDKLKNKKWWKMW